MSSRSMLQDEINLSRVDGGCHFYGEDDYVNIDVVVPGVNFERGVCYVCGEIH